MFVARSYDSAGGIMCVKSVCHTQQFTNDTYRQNDVRDGDTCTCGCTFTHVQYYVVGVRDFDVCTYSRMIHTQMNVHMW